MENLDEDLRFSASGNPRDLSENYQCQSNISLSVWFIAVIFQFDNINIRWCEAGEDAKDDRAKSVLIELT